MTDGNQIPEAPPVELKQTSVPDLGQAARATALFALLGMSCVAFVRLALGGEWAVAFLQRNSLPMDQRMGFILQLLIAAAAFALPVVSSTLFWSTKIESLSKKWEAWAWFLSPLILAPAIIVFTAHQAWFGKHQDLLPIMLFFAILAEFFFAQCYRHVPDWVRLRYRSLMERFENLDKKQTVRSAAPSPEQESHGESLEQETPIAPVALTQPPFVERHFWLIVVVIAALGYGLFMSFYTVRWHHRLGTAIFDLGINNNLLYGGLEGKINQSPIIFPEDPQKYIANHVKLGLYTFLPIYMFFPKPETLLVIQSVSLGLGAIPLFLFARGRLPQTWAAALALSYLAYYPMHSANFYEMKEPPTAAALVLTCIWAIDKGRYWMGGSFFLWALLMREEMPIPLAMVGAVFLLSGHRAKAGLVMAAIASTWFIILRFHIMNDVGSWWFPNMYKGLWSEPEKGFQSVIKTLLSNPTFTLTQIFVEKKFWYLLHLLVPLAFVPLRRWYGWAAMVPGAIITLLVTDYAPPTMFSFQYVMHFAPYFFVGAALVLADMCKVAGGPAAAFGALMAVCLSSGFLSYNYGAFPRRDRALETGYQKVKFSFGDEERAILADVRKIVSSIPKDATVAATERVGAHLSSRVGFYTLRRGSHGVEYIVARKKELNLDRTKTTVRDALVSGEYGVHARFGEFVAFKKGADTKDNAQIIEEWALKGSARSPKTNRSRTKERLDELTQEGEHAVDTAQDDDESSSDQDSEQRLE